MLKEVSRTIQRFGVKRAADMNVERSAAFVSLVVLDQQTAHLVAELDALVEALVALRLNDFSVALHNWMVCWLVFVF